MSRAALLPCPGDPFLLSLWFKYYERWSAEVDRLYVYVNSPSDKATIQYVKSIVDANPKTFFIYVDHQIEHGEALRQMVQLATEDHIMFVEDDAFIFKSGQVDKCFKQIEDGTYDIIGSKRGSCSLWLYQMASEKYNLDNSGYGDHGPNFWPNFFFAKRSDLLKVSNFGAKFWKEGEIVWPLGKNAAPEDQAADTFVQGSLELRAMGLRVAYVPQYHGNTDDWPDYEAKTGIWGPDCPWLHVGSLSSGFHGMLSPDYKLNIGQFASPQEKQELERRIVFWKWGLEEANKRGGLSALKEQYNQSLLKLVEGYTLSTSSIDKRINMYKEVMG
jgi:hypothetical protein